MSKHLTFNLLNFSGGLFLSSPAAVVVTGFGIGIVLDKGR